jgi:CBS domain-containing protein
MTTEVETIEGSMSVHDALENFFGRTQRHLAFPVVDDERKFLGIVTRADLLVQPPNKTLVEILPKSCAVALPEHSCRKITSLMARHNLSRLPVVHAHDPRKLLGIVTLSDVLKARAIEAEDETVRSGGLLSIKS